MLSGYHASPKRWKQMVARWWQTLRAGAAPASGRRASRHRARLEAELLESRLTPTVLANESYLLLGPADEQVAVTVTVTADDPSYPGLYLWQYHVENIDFYSSGEYDGIGVFFMFFSPDEDLANITPDGIPGTPTGDDGVHWSGIDTIEPGEGADFSFTTDPRKLALVGAEVWDPSFAFASAGGLILGPGGQYHLDLDVNDDTDLDDPADGVSNYLPGYGPDDPASADTTPKLSSGPFDATSYAPQRLNLVIEGVGSSSGFDQILFVIEDVTSYEGFAENASDPLVEGEGATDDYSFLPYEDSREAYGTMEADRTWVPFWAKDYGGWARVQVFGVIGATSVLLAQKNVPHDADGDVIADKWELAHVAWWEHQYGVTVLDPKLAFFSPNDDGEYKDPDGAGNGDGGTNLPEHKTEGDSLTVRQEYRGFILDGGGVIDWNGDEPVYWSGGHRLLSPVFKELLVETDIMKDVPNMPTLDEIKTILNTTAKGFSNKNDGAGIRMYWVIDEREAAPHKVFANVSERNEWAVDHKNAKLSEFVHLMYADYRSDSESGGVSGRTGAYVFIKREWDQAANRDDFLALLPHTTAHELTHLLLNTISANGFDAGEHLENPDPSDPPKSDKDKKYLMYVFTTPENRATIIFSNPTRMQIDLTSKESVERT